MTPLALQRLRERIPECELVLYTDLLSRTVLGADGAVRYPQEHLDVLCQCCADLFEAAQNDLCESCDHVLFFGPNGGRGFFRNLSEPGEALCCIFSSAVDVDYLVQSIKDALEPGTAAHE